MKISVLCIPGCVVTGEQGSHRPHDVPYIGKDAKLARQHRADVNAPKTPAPVFIMRDLPKVIVNLTENKHTICCA